jgi:signal peptidase I
MTKVPRENRSWTKEADRTADTPTRRSAAPATDGIESDGAADTARGTSVPGREGREKRSRSAGARGARRAAIAVVALAVLAIAVRTFVIAPYYIPSASMEPTLHGCGGCNNDHVLVNKLAYHVHDIHRGDVVVFHRPPNWNVSQNLLVKRVIGLPGDTLSERSGNVLVNGLPLAEPYVNDACTSGTSNLAEVTVPQGQVFVLGDNRCDSEDSRIFGAVPKSDVIGRAFIIIWPLGRLHWI